MKITRRHLRELISNEVERANLSEVAQAFLLGVPKASMNQIERGLRRRGDYSDAVAGVNKLINHWGWYDAKLGPGQDMKFDIQRVNKKLGSLASEGSFIGGRIPRLKRLDLSADKLRRLVTYLRTHRFEGRTISRSVLDRLFTAGWGILKKKASSELLASLDLDETIFA